MFRTTALATGLLTLALGFAACEKDNAADDLTNDPLALLLDGDNDALVDALVFQTPEAKTEARVLHFGREEGHCFHGDCFTLVFPVDVTFPDGSTATVDSAGGIRAAVRAYVRANPDRERPRVRPAFVFPIDVQLADGTIEALPNALALRTLARSCRPEPTPCATLVFPVSYDLGGTVTAFADAASLRAGLLAYRKSADRTTRPKPVFPVQFELESGEVVTVEGPAGLQAIRRRCDNKAPRGANAKDCFTFVLPVQVETRAGTVTISTEAGLRRALSHAGPRGQARLVFPLNVTLADGTVRAVDTRADLLAIRRDCK